MKVFTEKTGAWVEIPDGRTGRIIKQINNSYEVSIDNGGRKTYPIDCIKIVRDVPEREKKTKKKPQVETLFNLDPYTRKRR